MKIASKSISIGWEDSLFFFSSISALLSMFPGWCINWSYPLPPIPVFPAAAAQPSSCSGYARSLKPNLKARWRSVLCDGTDGWRRLKIWWGIIWKNLFKEWSSYPTIGIIQIEIDRVIFYHLDVTTVALLHIWYVLITGISWVTATDRRAVSRTDQRSVLYTEYHY